MQSTATTSTIPHPLSSLSDLENDAHVSDHTDAAHEPLLCVDNIQGNGLAGFKKDHQRFLLLSIVPGQAAAFKTWLGTQVNSFATAAEVLAFNRLFKALKDRRGSEGTVSATWTNVLFTAKGLRTLGFGPDVDASSDAPFQQSLAKSSPTLLDPTANDGSPGTWKFGGPNNEADVLIIQASDRSADLDEAEATLLRTLELQLSGDQMQSLGGAQPAFVIPVFRDIGKTLPSPLTGHEHFGWLDGVSQPGVRGRISPDATPTGQMDLLTPRQNPNDASQGQPGQNCIYPGSFVFGYPAQNPNSGSEPGEMKQGGTNFYDDGSLVVYRRLKQRVGAFNAMLSAKATGDAIDRDILGAKLVGRFKDGSPLVADDSATHAHIGSSDATANWFSFQSQLKSGATGDASQFALGSVPLPDPLGLKCPFAAHVRKANPRDDLGPASDVHRLLRRGIPYGQSLADGAPDDGVDRGLIFIAYQTSIADQFEFVTTNWVNNSNFRNAGSGVDPILGAAAGTRERKTAHIMMNRPDGDSDDITVDLTEDFIVPTGGGYFFSPSVDAIAKLAGVSGNPTRCLGNHPPITPPRPTPNPAPYPS